MEDDTPPCPRYGKAMDEEERESLNRTIARDAYLARTGKADPDPLLEEIEKACLRLQATWSPEEEERRRSPFYRTRSVQTEEARVATEDIGDEPLWGGLWCDDRDPMPTTKTKVPHNGKGFRQKHRMVTE